MSRDDTKPYGPSKLTQAVSDAIFEARKEGCTWDHIAKIVRVSRRQIIRWRELGRQGEEPYAEHYERWEQAQAEAIRDSLKKLRTDKDWRAVRDWLAINGVSAKQHIEVSGPEGGAIEHRLSIAGLDLDELEDKAWGEEGGD